MAEFDNFRKRTEKEKANMYAIGAKDIIEKILPVVDSFERGLATVENPEEDPFADGMNKVYKQFTTALDELGVTVIEAVGKEFDPNLHNAVMKKIRCRKSKTGLGIHQSCLFCLIRRKKP